MGFDGDGRIELAESLVEPASIQVHGGQLRVQLQPDFGGGGLEACPQLYIGRPYRSVPDTERGRYSVDPFEDSRPFVAVGPSMRGMETNHLLDERIALGVNG
jgi:hypothetical protein